MSSITPETTLGDIVSADARRARVLERYGLDFCCKGQRTLSEALRGSSHKFEDVASALNLPDETVAPISASVGSTAGLADLAHEIVDTHHAFLWEEMPRLQKIVDKVARVHGERHAELARVKELYTALVAELDPHMTTEERTLFPSIIKLERTRQPVFTPKGPIEDIIKGLMVEHDHAGDILKELRRITNNYSTPDDGCNTYKAMNASLLEVERDLHIHIHKENNLLFPAAVKLAQEISNSRK